MLAMMIGMTILMVVAFAICTGLAVMAYRKRNESADEDGGT
jgi:Na+/H+-dicarboxylate symporter